MTKQPFLPEHDPDEEFTSYKRPLLDEIESLEAEAWAAARAEAEAAAAARAATAAWETARSAWWKAWDAYQQAKAQAQ